MQPKLPIKSKIEQSMLDLLAKTVLNFWRKLQAMWFTWAEYNQHHPMFLVFIALIIMVDAVIVVLPGDVILVLAVLSNPTKWKRIWLAGSIGGVLGGIALYWLVSTLGADWLLKIATSVGATENIEWVRLHFNKYGLVLIAVGSCIPGASWTPVLLAGLADSPFLPVVGWLIVGRTVRYFIFCFGTREGWAIFHAVLEKAKADKENILKTTKQNESPPDDEPPQSSIQ